MISPLCLGSPMSPSLHTLSLLYNGCVSCCTAPHHYHPPADFLNPPMPPLYPSLSLSLSDYHTLGWAEILLTYIWRCLQHHVCVQASMCIIRVHASTYFTRKLNQDIKSKRNGWTAKTCKPSCFRLTAVFILVVTMTSNHRTIACDSEWLKIQKRWFFRGSRRWTIKADHLWTRSKSHSPMSAHSASVCGFPPCQLLHFGTLQVLHITVDHLQKAKMMSSQNRSN